MTKPDIEITALRSIVTAADRIGIDPDRVTSDLDAIMVSKFDREASDATGRIRAAYTLACRSAFNMLDTIADAFEKIGADTQPTIRVGMTHDVLAGEVMTIRVCVTEPIRPLWLVVDPMIAPMIEVRDIHIGHVRQQLVSDGPILATALAVIVDIARFDVITPDAPLEVTIRNRGSDLLTFRAAIIGRPPVT